MGYITNNANDMLENIKDDINRSYSYFKRNYDRYHEFRRFIFNSSLSAADRSILTDLGKPIVEFNGFI